MCLTYRYTLRISYRITNNNNNNNNNNNLRIITRVVILQLKNILILALKAKESCKAVQEAGFKDPALYNIKLNELPSFEGFCEGRKDGNRRFHYNLLS